MKLEKLGRIGKIIFGLILLSVAGFVVFVFIFLLNFPTKLPDVDINALARERSKYIGKELTIGPLFRLVKLKHYDGSEVDNYFYIFRINSDLVERYDLKVEKNILIEKPITFKVIGVDFRNSTVRSFYYCLLESSEFPGQIAQHECENLGDIHLLSK